MLFDLVTLENLTPLVAGMQNEMNEQSIPEAFETSSTLPSSLERGGWRLGGGERQRSALHCSFLIVNLDVVQTPLTEHGWGRERERERERETSGFK